MLGEVGTDAEAGISGSVSAMRWKVILWGGSPSGTGWPLRVPEVDVRTGRIPGDLSVYWVFLGCWHRGVEVVSVTATCVPKANGPVSKLPREYSQLLQLKASYHSVVSPKSYSVVHNLSPLKPPSYM